MKYLSSFPIYESQNSLSSHQIKFLNRFVSGKWEFDPSTGLVNVDGDFNCSGLKLNSLGGILFGTVTGNFNCSDNKLTELEGAPKVVGGWFSCMNNILSSLKGAPQEVVGGFNCHGNLLTSLDGAPKKLGEYVDFICARNKLTTLEGSPREVGGEFNCENNRITTLKKGPERVGGDFRCRSNPLSSLDGAPKEIGGQFRCGEFIIDKGKWNPEEWVDVFKNGNEKAKSLILTILSPLYINKEIQKDPEGMMMNLKGFWNSPDFASIRKDLVIPDRYKGEMDTLADLDDLGF